MSARHGIGAGTAAGALTLACWLMVLSAGGAGPMETNTAAPAPAASNAVPRLVDFGCGPKCLPCRLMLPILEDLKKTCAGKLDVMSVDVWEDPSQKAKYRIGVIPTQVFFAADGRELFRHVGFWSRADILKKWKELGVEPESGSSHR